MNPRISSQFSHFILSLIIISSLSTCQEYVPTSEKNILLTSGAWQFSGHLGEYIDTISYKRILDQTSWDSIYPETQEAFELKEDDNAYPKFGAWRGEFWGKYMLSVIAAARYYDSEELKNRIASSVNALLSLMREDGYLGTYKKTDFLEGNNWNIWGRKYTLWALVESYELLGDEKIIIAAQKFTDHLISEVQPGKMDIVRTGNFYGMPSTSILQPMVKLYNATGEQKYLDFAEHIVTQWSQHPAGLPDILNKGLNGKPVHLWFSEVDPMKWAKGYEFTSCVEGLVELYKVTNKAEYLTAAKNIHHVLVEYERTPVGSVSFNDKYAGATGLINTVAEICDAVYWNRLSLELFKLTADEKYIEEMERTLYNSLLCAFNPEGTWGLRRLRTSHIHIPAQNHFLYHHQCCTDNLPRGLFQAGEFVLMQADEKNIYLNLFNEGSGTIQLGENEVNMKLEGDFLAQSKVKTILSLEKSQAFRLNVRIPNWCKEMSIKVNGSEYSGQIIDPRWLILDRKWQDEDEIDILFDIPLRWETFEAEKFDSSFHSIDFYNDHWAKMKFLGGTFDFNNERYKHIDTLKVAEALPQEEAIMFFYGPVALSRDIRVSQGNVFDRIPQPVSRESISIKHVEAPQNIWKVFEVDLGNGQIERFCDFSSAGNTWDNGSLFNTWCLLKD